MTPDTTLPMADSISVRDYLTNALRLDLIGPRPQDAELQNERLPQAPSRWYLTGFLVPTNAPDVQRAQDNEEELDEAVDQVHGSDDSSTPDRGSGKQNFLPSSIGLSIIVDEETTRLDVEVSWGDYEPESYEEESAVSEGEASSADGKNNGDNGFSQRRFSPWVRRSRTEAVTIDLADVKSDKPATFEVPDSNGLEIVCLVRSTRVQTFDDVLNARAISAFVVNRRTPEDRSDLQDTAFAFQVAMGIEADRPFVPRPDPRGLESADWDERVADLHYSDVFEYAVGHNVSSRAEIADDKCRRVHTEWIPRAFVDRVEPSPIDNVEFGMENLGSLDNATVARGVLGPLVTQYRNWIDNQSKEMQALNGRRREVAQNLVTRAGQAANRIETGIALLSDPDVLEAFRIANRAMASSARRRRAQEEGVDPKKVDPPEWRPFQLAYILMNLRGIAEPAHIEREIVDLLFFPTGGGKTEAYLGLAAFTLVLRRLRNPDPAHRGLSVLMRYTLRLLTLDQLGRAAAVICALELEREKAPDTLGTWPFEIALWVGRAATPNYMGSKDNRSDQTARVKTLRFKQDTTREPPVPLEQCPWCGKEFNRYSFHLEPNIDNPQNLLVRCANRRCDFAGRRNLPIVAVDEPIYDRLPAFMIATADKFASLPWNGNTAKFFRGHDQDNPMPPDLIIQDELHLISGPLGTMAGLYETAIDHLCKLRVDDKEVRPKVIASTATVRMAAKQVRALFNRSLIDVFPSPGICRRDSFFARHAATSEMNRRLYLGIAAQGRGPKVVFLRSMTTLMAAAQAAWKKNEHTKPPNPADPYMTAVAYFNALRELGNARRIVEDEISSRLQTYATRKRIGETAGLFDNRHIAIEPVELTSRVGTAAVADAKRKLALDFDEDGSVDVALATNMISVGLDITRLGMMVVSGQPKTTSEYIQATSRVGRDPSRPGLVVTLLNIHKPRDRSHYERFASYHESFYKGVEATSVTPFSPRAMDRGLPAVVVALARLGIPELTEIAEAKNVEDFDTETKEIARAVSERAGSHVDGLPEDFVNFVRGRVQSLIDDWAKLAHNAGEGGVTFGYSNERNSGVSVPLLREMIDPERDTLNETQLRFRAPRSLRDVEPIALLGLKTPDGQDIN
ncbi:MAG: helicase-related protein [Gemmatimonadota bacterium]|nr:helicase-related protein [Gemmatimonadota bacterium]